MRFGRFMPMFDANGGQNGSGGAATGAAQTTTAGTTPQTPPAAAPAFDYDKIVQLIAGKQAATEDSVL